MASFFSSPDTFDGLHTRGINCCGTVRQMTEGSDNKKLKVEQGCIHARVKGNPTAMIWKDEMCTDECIQTTNSRQYL